MHRFHIRVASKSDPHTYRTLTIDGGAVRCDCDGFDGAICSHLDAVILAGERFMVPVEDHPLAEEACRLIAGAVIIPESWKGSWRRNLQWRGLSSESPRRRVGGAGKPVVCFTGAMSRPRKELIAEAEAAGWETVDGPSPAITVLVAADARATTGKLSYARKNAIPIVALDEWPDLMLDGVIG